jgi:NAD(P)H-dependent flavin oxidoreductase YrpB (nitropropane dioxygenase family)
MNKLFNSKYPIVEASMNGGSSLDLAIAVYRAGAFPSLFLDRHNYKESKQQLETFQQITNGNNVVIPMGSNELLDKSFFKLIHKFAPSHIELLPSDSTGNVNNLDSYFANASIMSTLEHLRQCSKLILRLYEPANEHIAQHVNAFYIKGLESAGKTGTWSVKDLFLEQKNITPAIPVIPYGGIGTPQQVQWYIDHGAEAVGVGTVFATCIESPLSLEVKQRMIKMSSFDLTLLPDTQQNCVVLGSVSPIESDWNRCNSLKQGLNGDGTQGHVYLGHSVNHINKIRTVQEAVQYLCSSL